MADFERDPDCSIVSGGRRGLLAYEVDASGNVTFPFPDRPYWLVDAETARRAIEEADLSEAERTEFAAWRYEPTPEQAERYHLVRWAGNDPEPAYIWPPANATLAKKRRVFRHLLAAA